MVPPTVGGVLLHQLTRQPPTDIPNIPTTCPQVSLISAIPQRSVFSQMTRGSVDLTKQSRAHEICLIRSVEQSCLLSQCTQPTLDYLQNQKFACGVKSKVPEADRSLVACHTLFFLFTNFSSRDNFIRAVQSLSANVLDIHRIWEHIVQFIE